jgi:hypothetical protein
VPDPSQAEESKSEWNLHKSLRTTQGGGALERTACVCLSGCMCHVLFVPIRDAAAVRLSVRRQRATWRSRRPSGLSRSRCLSLSGGRKGLRTWTCMSVGSVSWGCQWLCQ